MTIADSDRELLIKRNLEKAHEAINDVAFLIENRRLNLAVNRIYYGIFYSLTALALRDQFSTRKHQQLIGWFNQTYIKTGKIEKKYGATVHMAYDMRAKGDYGDIFDFPSELIIEMFGEMKTFIEIIETISIR
jgi:uncharacterized protein (UPF0332 family)